MTNRIWLTLLCLAAPAGIAAQATVSISNPPAWAGPNAVIAITETIRNGGTVTTPAGTQTIALFPAVGGGPMTIIGSRSYPRLAAGALSTATTNVTIPPNISPGTYVVGAGRIFAVGCLGCRKSTGTFTVAAQPDVTLQVYTSGYGTVSGGLESDPFHQPYFHQCSVPSGLGYPQGCITSGPSGSVFIVTGYPGSIPGVPPFGHSHPAVFTGLSGVGCAGALNNGVYRIVLTSSVTCTAQFQ